MRETILPMAAPSSSTSAPIGIGFRAQRHQPRFGPAEEMRARDDFLPG